MIISIFGSTEFGKILKDVQIGIFRLLGDGYVSSEEADWLNRTSFQKVSERCREFLNNLSESDFIPKGNGSYDFPPCRLPKIDKYVMYAKAEICMGLAMMNVLFQSKFDQNLIVGSEIKDYNVSTKAVIDKVTDEKWLEEHLKGAYRRYQDERLEKARYYRDMHYAYTAASEYLADIVETVESPEVSKPGKLFDRIFKKSEHWRYIRLHGVLKLAEDAVEKLCLGAFIHDSEFRWNLRAKTFRKLGKRKKVELDSYAGMTLLLVERMLGANDGFHCSEIGYFDLFDVDNRKEVLKKLDFLSSTVDVPGFEGLITKEKN